MKKTIIPEGKEQEVTSFFKEKGIAFREKAPMSEYTSFRAGGNATLAVFPQNEDELLSALSFLSKEKIKHVLIGNGTNVLFADEGYGGVVLLTDKLKQMTVNGCEITASCGVSLSALAKRACDASFSGGEFLYGIPGTVGGGICMNAGAYGGEIADILTSCRYYDCQTDSLHTVSADECKLSYRHSLFQEKKAVVLSAVFSFKPGKKEEIEATMKELLNRRREKQPLEYPSAGSAFKRPKDGFAAKLIDDCSLKGYTVGGAAVSEKHAGFVINKGNATASDIRRLMEDVQAIVHEKTGIFLEPEVKFIC